MALLVALSACFASAALAAPRDSTYVEEENDLARFNVSAVRIALNARVSLSLNATVVDDGAFIAITISNPDFKKRGDFLSMYLADADTSQTSPLKWTYCVPYIPGYNTSGTGTAVFQVYNVRANITFYLGTGSTSNPTLIATSSPVSFTDPSAPVHPRIMPGATVGDYAVVWTTSALATSPTLKWGVVSTQYPNTVAATTKTVAKDALCGAPATTYGFMDLGVTAFAPFTGLGAQYGGRTVYYILTDTDGRTSAEYSFFVPPLPGPVYPFRFSGFGDLGRGSYDTGITWNEYGAASRDTSLLLLTDSQGPERPAFIHHWGDISYAVGFLQTWDEYLWMSSQFAAQTVYVVGVGNHESDYPGSSSWSYYGDAKDSGGECSVVTTTVLPPPAPASSEQPWFTFASGPVFVVVLSSEHDFTTGSAQLTWLQGTLEAVNRTLTPFLIVTAHRPMYINSNFGPCSTSPTGDICVMTLLQANVEPITHANKVTLMLYGHNHRYERISAAYQNAVVQASSPMTIDGNTVNVFSNPGATVHYVAGTAGASFSQNDCHSTGDPCPPWSEEVGFAHGFLRFTALNSTALSFEYVDSENEAGTVLDRVLIIQETLDAWV